MDTERARELLEAERERVQGLLDEVSAAGQANRVAADEQPGDIADSAEPQTGEEGDDAVAAELRDRLDAIARAERRLDAGTYGLSVRSGRPIPDERLEADPAAELTVDEAEEG